MSRLLGKRASNLVNNNLFNKILAGYAWCVGLYLTLNKVFRFQFLILVSYRNRTIHENRHSRLFSSFLPVSNTPFRIIIVTFLKTLWKCRSPFQRAI